MEKVTLWDGAGGTPSRPTLMTSASWGTALDAMVNEEEEADLLCLWITFLCSVFSMNPDKAFTEAAESSLALSAQGKETVQEILSSRATHPAVDEVLMLTSRQSPPKHQTTTHTLNTTMAASNTTAKSTATRLTQLALLLSCLTQSSAFVPSSIPSSSLSHYEQRTTTSSSALQMAEPFEMMVELPGRGEMSAKMKFMPVLDVPSEIVEVRYKVR
jgi:hypothetical protein